MLTYYNFCRIHKTLKVTPAMAAGVTSELRDVDWIAELVAERDPKPGIERAVPEAPEAGSSLGQFSN